MSVGKIVALSCGILALLAFIFLMNAPQKANLNADINETADLASLNLAPSDEILDSNLSYAEDIKKIKVLEKSLRKAPKNLSKLYLINCAPCHFKDGKGEIAPQIAGKSKEEILNKLRAFKENTIPNTLMHGLLINLKESDLETLASEISGFKDDE